MALRRPRVHVVVLNHRSEADTVRCVESVLASSGPPVFPIVVDSASTVASREVLHAALPSRTIVALDDNLGYAGGNNAGIRVALERDSDVVVLLNPDTAVDPGAIARLARTCLERPDVGAVGARVLAGASRPARLQADGALVDRHDGDVTLRHGTDLAADHPPSGVTEVDYALGCAIALPAGAIEAVGLLPERYFLYYEETDWCLAAAEAGRPVVVDDRALVHHYRASHGDVPTPAYLYYYVRARHLFAQRWCSGGEADVDEALDTFVDGWRRRVAQARPDLLDAYDDLAAVARAHGADGRGGRWDGLAAHPWTAGVAA